MPILAEETSVFPSQLLEGLTQEPSERMWWAVYTKSRQEKALARYLCSRSIPFYLPVIDKMSLIRGRKVRSSIPLFANYLFMFGTEEERTCGLQSNRISQILTVHDQMRFDGDLQSVCRLTTSSMDLTMESRLVPGQRVRVRKGTFEGLEGTVVLRRGKTRLVVHVDFLQQGASVEIDDFLFEPID